MRLVAPSKQQILLGLALALLGAAYLGLLFYRGFSDPDEGRYAEIPREMVATGHWGEMRMLGYRYYEKPPLAYWTIAPAIAVCGAQEWAVRIPLLINGLLLLGLLHLLLRRHWSGAPGRQALLVLATLIGFALGFCLLLTDGFLSFWFSLTCCALFWAFQPLAKPQLKPAFLLLAAAAAALGVLTKGMVALLLPAAIVLLWLAWERRLSALLTKGLPLAAGLFLAILTPAAMWIEQHNPGFIRHFIFEEHIARFLGTRATQLHEEPCWFYAATLVPLLLPWSLFVPRALRNVIKGRHWRHDILTRFFIVWMMVVIVFFSVGTGKLMP
ncbi:MAG: phospholipid carrier-dependent glycosyltransferase [Lentisphaerae bacterium]|nr:phospholipid carrier-dependent glycosyltransferase [Lentisphaerota bacterium]